jgi:hypothetical protein
VRSLILIHHQSNDSFRPFVLVVAKARNANPSEFGVHLLDLVKTLAANLTALRENLDRRGFVHLFSLEEFFDENRSPEIMLFISTSYRLNVKDASKAGRPPNKVFIFRSFLTFLYPLLVQLGLLEPKENRGGNWVTEEWKKVQGDELAIWDRRSTLQKKWHEELWPNYAYRPIKGKDAVRAEDGDGEGDVSPTVIQPLKSSWTANKGRKWPYETIVDLSTNVTGPSSTAADVAVPPTLLTLTQPALFDSVVDALPSVDLTNETGYWILVPSVPTMSSSSLSLPTGNYVDVGYAARQQAPSVEYENAAYIGELRPSPFDPMWSMPQDVVSEPQTQTRPHPSPIDYYQDNNFNVNATASNPGALWECHALPQDPTMMTLHNDYVQMRSEARTEPEMLMNVASGIMNDVPPRLDDYDHHLRNRFQSFPSSDTATNIATPSANFENVDANVPLGFPDLGTDLANDIDPSYSYTVTPGSSYTFDQGYDSQVPMGSGSGNDFSGGSWERNEESGGGYTDRSIFY